MVDVARLGLAVDSSQVERGTVTLHQLTGAAGQASAAAQRLAGASQADAAGQKAATAATAAHTAALHANNAAMRMGNQVRTNMIYQLNDVGVSLASGMSPVMVAVQQLPQMLQFGLKPALDSIIGLAKGLVTTFWPVAAVIGVVTAGIAGLTYEINKTADVQVGFFDVALAGWQLLAESIGNTLGPVWLWIVDKLQWVWDTVSPIVAGVANTIIGALVGAFEAVKASWNLLPGALGDLVFQAAGAVVNGVIYMIREVQVQFNNLMGWVDGKLLELGAKPLGIRGDLMQYANIANPFSGQAGNLAGAASEAYAGAQGDYVGAGLSALSQRAQEIAAARGEVEALGGAAVAANDNIKEIGKDGFASVTSWAQEFGDAARSAFSNLGSGIIEAFQKGGDVAQNVLSMLMDKVGQFGETLLNNGLNGLLSMGLNALGGALGGGTWGQFGGFSGFAGSFGIPGMATGGTVGRSGLSWVGEKGPELLRLPAGASVIPNGPSMAMAVNGNGANDNTRRGDVHLHINGSNLTQAEMEAAIAGAMDRYDRYTLPNRVAAINADPLARG